MTTLTKLVIGALLSVLLYSCNFITGVQGNGNVVTTDRDITKTFDSVKASSGLNVILRQGNQVSVSVEADENLQEHIIVEVDDNKLRIKTDTNIGRADSKRVLVTYTKLTGLSATSGADVTHNGKIHSENFEISVTSGGYAMLDVNCSNLKAKATSGGNLRVAGTADILEASATTGANLKAENLLATSVIAKATTGAELKVNAQGSISAKATTGGNISYKGNPNQQDISKSDTTGGSITKG